MMTDEDVEGNGLCLIEGTARYELPLMSSKLLRLKVSVFQEFCKQRDPIAAVSQFDLSSCSW
jgi:hypothetical protein